MTFKTAKFKASNQMQPAAFERIRADVGMRLQPDEAGDGRKWNTLFPTGKWHHHTGTKLDLTPALAAEFLANWKAAGSPRLPITMHHAPEPEAGGMSRADLEEAKKARGWIEDLRIGKGDSLIEAAIKWTDATKKLIDADEYAYISPEWSMAHKDRRTGEVGGAWIWGAALTNEPFFDSMPRVAASHETQPTQSPNNAALKAEEKHMSLLRTRAALRLKEDASETEIAEATEKLVAAAADHEVKLTAAAKQTAETTVLKASNDVLKASLESLEKKFAAAEVEKQGAAILALIDGARREGKAMPEPVVASITVLAKHNFEEAKKLVAALPKNPALAAEMGVSVKGNEGEETPDSANAKLNEMIAALAKTEGLSHFDARMKLIASQPKLSAIAAQKLSTRKDA